MHQRDRSFFLGDDMAATEWSAGEIVLRLGTGLPRELIRRLVNG
jgi:hypothetical protein